MASTNQQMTREQLDELMVVAVRMQRDAEKLDERPVAVFAYAVQLVLAELQNTRQQLAAVVAENAGMNAFVDALLSISWQGCSADGAEIQELAFKHGLIHQEVYSADEHETLVYDPGNFEDGDSVYFRVESPATDAYLAEVRAQAIRDALGASSDYLDTDCVMDRLDIRYEDAELRTSGAIELHDALVVIANELRQGAKS